MYDLYVKTGEQKALELAQRLGWSGLGIIGDASETHRLDVVPSVEIAGATANTLQNQVKKLRSQVPLIAVASSSAELNRAAVETPEVDLLHTDQPLDQVMMRLARRNNVAVVFNFSTLRHAHQITRAEVFGQYLETAKLVQKCHAPFVLSSGALSPWDLCAPQDLVSFGRLLGFTDPAIKESLSGKMVAENRKRLSGKWVMPGVEIK